jgi:hypothetical protein
VVLERANDALEDVGVDLIDVDADELDAQERMQGPDLERHPDGSSAISISS